MNRIKLRFMNDLDRYLTGLRRKVKETRRKHSISFSTFGKICGNDRVLRHLEHETMNLRTLRKVQNTVDDPKAAIETFRETRKGRGRGK